MRQAGAALSDLDGIGSSLGAVGSLPGDLKQTQAQAESEGRSHEPPTHRRAVTAASMKEESFGNVLGSEPPPAALDDLAERLKRILDDEARRHGIDV